MRSPPLGIFGGTFDPIHFGHLEPLKEVAEKTGISEVLIIPSAAPPHREPPVASAKDRLDMATLALQAYPMFKLDDREFHRSGPSWTVDTLKSLREEWPQRPLALIIGEDALHGFTRWKHWQDIPRLAHIVAMHRPHDSNDKKALPEWASKRQVFEVDQLGMSPFGHFFFVEVSPNTISASKLRARLKSGEEVFGMIPDSVIQYIHQRKLYR